MEAGNVALILFYGVFWAAALSAAGRFRAFDTHTFFSGKTRRYAVNRFLVALFIINLCPVVWLWLLYVYIVPNEAGALPIMSAAFASLSVFGFHRILHAIIATDNFYSKFYSNEEWKAIINQWGRGGPNTFAAHFFPGIGFLIIFLLIAYALGCL
jgi:hypothetical protein